MTRAYEAITEEPPGYLAISAEFVTPQSALKVSENSIENLERPYFYASIGEGWSRIPNPDYIWSTAYQSTLYLPPSSDQIGAVELIFSPFAGRQEVTFSTPSFSATQVITTRLFEVCIPLEPNVTTLTLDIPGARRPADINPDSTDHRLIGVGYFGWRAKIACD